MSKKLAIRAAILIVSMVLLFTGYQWFQSWSLDPENEAKVDTAGAIAALEMTGSDPKAVVFLADGTEKSAPALPEGRQDREISWGATGSHVFISSNREDDSFNIYRWNPISGAFDRRSQGTRSKAAPFFVLDGTVESQRRGLVTGGGAVSIFDPKMMTMEQILPPLEIGVDSSDDGGGMVGPMSGAYKSIGDSFKSARYIGGNKLIYTLMRREGGEVLVVSNLEPVQRPDGTMSPPPPMPILAGRKLAWDVAPNGAAVVAINDFQWPDPDQVPPDFVKNGEATTPFRHALMSLPSPTGGAGQQQGPIVVFPDSGQKAGDLSVSPDGSMVAVVIGVEKDENFVPQGLIVFPNMPGGGQQGVPISEGAISAPSWSPDGKELVYLKTSGGKRGIFRVSATGGVEKRVGKTDKDYRSPKFSPQAAS